MTELTLSLRETVEAMLTFRLPPTRFTFATAVAFRLFWIALFLGATVGLWG